jgi:LuxR family maltose regulon positive regulatory protein
MSRKLTLISAPAGFGKTTLLSEWADNLRLEAAKESQIEKHVAWLSLDESDNDPARFLAYFIAALQTIAEKVGKGALSALHSPQPPPVEVVLTALINEIAALPGRIVLIRNHHLDHHMW